VGLEAATLPPKVYQPLDGRRPDSSPKGFTVAGQRRIRTGLRSCVLKSHRATRDPWPRHQLV